MTPDQISCGLRVAYFTVAFRTPNKDIFSQKACFKKPLLPEKLVEKPVCRFFSIKPCVLSSPVQVQNAFIFVNFFINADKHDLSTESENLQLICTFSSILENKINCNPHPLLISFIQRARKALFIFLFIHPLCGN